MVSKSAAISQLRPDYFQTHAFCLSCSLYLGLTYSVLAFSSKTNEGLLQLSVVLVISQVIGIFDDSCTIIGSLCRLLESPAFILV